MEGAVVFEEETHATVDVILAAKMKSCGCRAYPLERTLVLSKGGTFCFDHGQAINKKLAKTLIGPALNKIIY